MNRDRAYRRHQKNRYIKKAFDKLKHWYWCIRYPDNEIMESAKRMADNFTTCSCEMCKNPRHSVLTHSDEKLTIQERKSKEDAFVV